MQKTGGKRNGIDCRKEETKVKNRRKTAIRKGERKSKLL